MERMITRKMLQQLGRTRWLRFGVRDRIIRALDHPDRCRQEAFTVPFFNMRYQGRFDQYIDWSLFYYGAYSFEELELLYDLLNSLDKPTFVDVGANVGQHSLFASQFASAVHSFEPFHLVADQFAGQIERNAIQNIQLHRVGLGSEDKTLNFHAPTTRNLGTGSFSSRNGTAIPLRIRQADLYFAEKGIAPIDVIKIDTEGFEAEVLTGLNETLRAYRPVVFFEWTPNAQPRRVDNPLSLLPSDYRLYKFVPEVIVALFFRYRSYRLRAVHGEVAAGNYLAAPQDIINRLPRRE